MRLETTVLQNAQSAQGNGAVLGAVQYDGVVVYVRTSAGVSAGSVQVEEDLDGTGTTWAPVGAAITANAATATFAQHLNDRVYGNLRARIATAITGGTVTVTATGRVSQFA